MPRFTTVLGRATFAAVLAGGAVIVTDWDAGAAPVASCSDSAQPGTGIVLSTDSRQDIDADGYSDLVIGVPSATSVGGAQAGVIDIRYGAGTSSGARNPQRVGESYFAGIPAAAGDQFGASAAITEVDGQHCEDVAVGAPGANGGRGAVVIANGSVDGLSPSGAIRVSGKTTGERFGSAVVAAGRDIWIAAPNRTVNGQAQAGAVDHYRVDDGAATLVETLQQGNSGIGGSPEAGDHFGQALAAGHGGTVAIGIPDESIGSIKKAGLITVVRTSASTHKMTGSQSVGQNSTGIGGNAETGDRFGAAVSSPVGTETGPAASTRVAVGSPGESVGSATSAGMVQLIDFTSASAYRDRGAITQSTPSVSGAVEAGDQFGATVLIGSFTNDSSWDYDGGVPWGDLELAIGSPGEDLGTVKDAGTVAIIRIHVSDTTNALTLTQDVPTIQRGGSTHDFPNLSGAPTSGDRVGAGLSAVGLSDESLNDGFETFTEGGAQLAVATPGQDSSGAADAGAVTLLRRDLLDGNDGASTTVRDSAGPVAGEHYGMGANTDTQSVYSSGNSG